MTLVGSSAGRVVKLPLLERAGISAVAGGIAGGFTKRSFTPRREAKLQTKGASKQYSGPLDVVAKVCLILAAMMEVATEVAPEAPVIKRLKRAAECALQMVLEDSEMLHGFPHAELETPVVCLSQTIRTLGDKEVENRVAVVAPSVIQPIPWDEFLLRDKFTSMWARSVLFCEAFKILEADFIEVLQSLFGMPAYRQTVRKLKAVILFSAKSLKHHISHPRESTFGIFALALVHLYDVEGTKITESQREELKSRIDLGRSLFMEVVEESFVALKDKCANENVDMDAQIEVAFDFMGKEENFQVTVREWAAASGTRPARNASAHPFSDLTSHHERQTAIDYFASLLDGDYCQRFQNVALLGKLQLQLSDMKETLAPVNAGSIEDFLR